MDSAFAERDETLSALVRARYRQEEAVGSLRANAVLETLLSHRSVRAYLPTPLPEGALETLVAAAQSAASSSNLQTWSVVVVADRDRRARLAHLAGDQAHIAEAPVFLVWLADLARLRAIALAAGRQAEGLEYLEAFVLGVVDAALAAQNALVAAESLGLGGCYIGALRNRPQEVAAELGLPPEAVAAFGLTLGYPDPSRPAAVQPRLEPAVVLHRERYRQTAPEALGRYNQSMRAFQAEQGSPAVNWTDQACARVASAKALNGRHLLAVALQALGFRLK